MDDYLFEARAIWKFNGSVLVAHRGNVILSNGYGMADRDMGIPNTAYTRFFIGSITKQFTAAAILQLMERGKLELDKPVSEYLDDYPPPWGDKITIRHLLSHTSGLPNYTDIPEIYVTRDEPVTQEELLRIVKSLELEFEPGTDFLYSNSGYVVLGEVIEAVSGVSYEVYLHKYIFEPAGMHSTGYARREAGVPDRATGYTVTKDFEIIPASRVDYSLLYSAGALYSTVDDMLKWDQVLYGDSILSEKTRNLMFTPGKGIYGFGWRILDLHGGRVASHSGFIDGFNCTIDRWLDNGLLVVVFSNEDEAPVGKIASALKNIAFGKLNYHQMPQTRDPGQIDPELLTDYTGIYTFQDKIYHAVFVEDGKLYTRIWKHNPIRLIPESKDRFFTASDNSITAYFHRNADGEVDTQFIGYGDIVLPARRLSRDEVITLHGLSREPAEIDSSTISRYGGSYRVVPEYRDHDIDIRIEVEPGPDRLIVKVQGQEKTEVFPSSRNSFFGPQSDFALHFVESGDSKVIGCIVNFGPSGVYAEKIE